MPSCHCAGPPRFSGKACSAAGPTFLGSSGVDLQYWERWTSFLASILSMALVKGRCFKTKQNRMKQNKTNCGWKWNRWLKSSQVIWAVFYQTHFKLMLACAHVVPAHRGAWWWVEGVRFQLVYSIWTNKSFLSSPPVSKCVAFATLVSLLSSLKVFPSEICFYAAVQR